MMFSSRVEKLAHSAVEAINNNDLHAFLRSFEEDFEFVDQALGLTCKSAAELGQYFGEMRRLFPTSVIAIQEAIVSSDQLALRWTLRGNASVTHFQGERDQEFTFSGMSYVRAKGERIDCWMDYYDRIDSGRTSVIEAVRGWVEL